MVSKAQFVGLDWNRITRLNKTFSTFSLFLNKILLLSLLDLFTDQNDRFPYTFLNTSTSGIPILSYT